MVIKEGTKLKIHHSRKGEFVGILTKDFNEERDEWIPVILAKGRVDGLSAFTHWIEGEAIPCRKVFCRYEVLEEK